MYWGQFKMFSLGLASKLGWQPVTIAHLDPFATCIKVEEIDNM
jgi:hypothetical protein